MQRIKRALIASVGTLGLLSGVGGVAAMVAPTAAHASTSEAYIDISAQMACRFYTCGTPEVVLAQSSGDLVTVGNGTPTTWSVFFNGAGYWCLTDGNGDWLGVGATDQLITDYANGQCNQGGEEWVISCTGNHANEFNLENVHTGDYVGPNSGGVYHANISTGGDVYQDESATECA